MAVSSVLVNNDRDLTRLDSNTVRQACLEVWFVSSLFEVVERRAVVQLVQHNYLRVSRQVCITLAKLKLKQSKPSQQGNLPCIRDVARATVSQHARL